MKIYIFGSVASGKTTLARRLSQQYGIPFFEGDCIAWGFDDDHQRKHLPEEQRQIIEEIDKGGDWIIEGTYRESQRCLFDLAERIIYLDTPLKLRCRRLWKRYFKQKLGLEKCHYKPNFRLYRLMSRWTKDFDKNRKLYEDILNKYPEKLIWIRSDDDIEKLSLE
ncbi:MAG: hypothetical protein ACI4JJ_08455 [Huintestinicola sp.]